MTDENRTIHPDGSTSDPESFILTGDGSDKAPIEQKWWGLKYLWCWIAHSKHRERTGKYRDRKSSRFYQLKCKKCGNYDIDHVIL